MGKIASYHVERAPYGSPAGSKPCRHSAVTGQCNRRVWMLGVRNMCCALPSDIIKVRSDGYRIKLVKVRGWKRPSLVTVFLSEAPCVGSKLGSGRCQMGWKFFWRSNGRCNRKILPSTAVLTNAFHATTINILSPFCLATGDRGSRFFDRVVPYK